MNPFIATVKRWAESDKGLVRSASDDWAKSQFPADWISALSGRVLEIGPGGGRQTELLLNAGCEVEIADISPEICFHVQAEFPAVRQCYGLLGGGSIPAPVEWYDAVVACYVFVHCRIDVVYRYLQEIERVLKRGGTLVCDFKVLGAETFKDFERCYMRDGAAPIGTDEFHCRFVSPEIVAILAGHAGLAVADERGYPLCTRAYRMDKVR